jgi:hydroxymethylbilane synthase
MFPNPEFVEIRGNVDTRLRKIADQHVADATILAAAGLKRLGIGSWPGVDFRPIPFETMVPAVGQGAIAVQCRSADASRFAGVFDPATARGIGLERAIQTAIGGGCNTALGAYAAEGKLYLFHEAVGLKVFAIGDGDLDDPVAAAAGILARAGLK